MPTQVSILIAIVAVIIGLIQIVPIIVSGAKVLHEKVVGEPPIDKPLKEQLNGALLEMDENLECLVTYNDLRTTSPDWALCRPKYRFMKSLTKQFSVLSSRDYYFDSSAAYPYWTKLIHSYEELSKIKVQSDFLNHEKNAELTLRDTLYLTAFFKYYYEKYFYEMRHCYEENAEANLQECENLNLVEEARIKKYDYQIARWKEWPARATIIEGERADKVHDWLFHMD
jgi:hypothetical protein